MSISLSNTHDTDNNVTIFPVKSTEYNDTATIIANITDNIINFFIKVPYLLPNSTDSLVLRQYFEANLVVINNNEQCQVINSNMTYDGNTSLFYVDYFCRENIKNLNIIHQLFGVFLESFDNQLIINYKNKESKYHLNRTIILANFNTDLIDSRNLLSPTTSTMLLKPTSSSVIENKKDLSTNAIKAPVSTYTFILISLLVLLIVYKYISSRRSKYSWGKKPFWKL